MGMVAPSKTSVPSAGDVTLTVGGIVPESTISIYWPMNNLVLPVVPFSIMPLDAVR